MWHNDYENVFNNCACPSQSEERNFVRGNYKGVLRFFFTNPQLSDPNQFRIINVEECYYFRLRILSSPLPSIEIQIEKQKWIRENRK